MKKSVEEIFHEFFRGYTNLMTPERLSFGEIPRFRDRILIWELSSGRGISNQKIYGVTVLEINTSRQVTKRHFDLSDCFMSEKDARAHIEELKKEDIGEASSEEIPKPWAS